MAKSTMQITIWDHDAKRIADLDRLIHECAKGLALKVAVNSVSEPPALARENLMGRVPVLEIGGKFWSLKAGRMPGSEELTTLLKRFAPPGTKP